MFPIRRERGFVLIAVVVTITLLAAIAFMLSYQGASESSIASGELEHDQLRYIAEAGLAHAGLRLAGNTSCSGYTDIATTNFAGESYSATVSPNNGSPVTLSSVGTLADGTKKTLTRSRVKTYQPSTTLVLQPDAAEGKDTNVYEWKSAWNYGAAESLRVENAIAGDWSNALIEFDLSSIPAAARIVSATLELNQSAPAASGGDFSIHRITSTWVEGSKDGNNGSPNWTERDAGVAWSTAGGDFDPVAVASTNIPSGTGVHQWSIDELVQEWVSGKHANLGLAVVPASYGSDAFFSSSDSTDATIRPKLTIMLACECGKTCGTAPPAGNNVLLVVADAVNLAAQDAAKQALIEGWGHTVNLIDDNAAQAEFDTAYTVNDVVYVSEEILTGAISTKLRNATIGVVFEEQKIPDELGLSSAESVYFETSIDIIDNSHYITETFSTGALTIVSSSQEVGDLGGTLAPGLQILARRPSSTRPTLAVIETGGALFDGGTAEGRRVKVPWGGNTFDINALTADGETIMRRAIEWGAAAEDENSLLPVAHWKMDETSGTTAADSVGGHDGTLVNGPVWNTGKLDGALEFDGANDYVDIPYDSSLSITGEMSFSAWVNLSSFGSGYQTIVTSDDDGSGSNYWFGAFEDELAFGFYGGPGGFFQGAFTSGLGLQPGTWYHLGATFDDASDEVRLFVNGAEFSVESLTVSPTVVPANISIGRSGYGEYWHGSLDDVRIYDELLSESLMAELASASAGGPIAHWKLDDGAGLTAIDSEGSNDGTLTNGPVWVAGRIGDALDFDGVDDYVDAGTFDVSGSGITMMGWFNADTISDLDPRIISKADGGNDFNAWWQLSTTDGGPNRFMRMRIKAGGTTTELASYTETVVPGQWYFAVGTYDSASGEMKLYLNGVQIDTLAHSVGGPVDTDASVPVAIGANGTADRFFDGKLDDVRVYDRALSATEISDIYAAVGGGGGGGQPPGGSGIVLESFSEAKLPAAGTSINVPGPSGTVVGDLLIAVVVTDIQQKPTMSTATGWSVVDHGDTSKQVTMDVHWKIAGASEPTSYDFGWAKSAEAYAFIMRFSGHDPASPIHAFRVDGASSSTPLSPAVTTSVANALILRIGGFDDDDITIDDPGLAGHTAITMDASGTGASTASGGAGYVIQSSPGDSGTANFTLGASEEYRTVTIAIAPAP